MKKANLLLVVGIMLSAAQARADFNGKWVGTGRVSNNQGLNVACQNVVLVITQTATQMNIQSTFQCGSQTIAGPAGALTIKGNEVFSASGAKIGTVSDTTCDLGFNGADGSMMTSNEHIVGNQMAFKTVQGNGKGLVTAFEGTATR